jgi:hypothetical protein
MDEQIIKQFNGLTVNEPLKCEPLAYRPLKCEPLAYKPIEPSIARSLVISAPNISNNTFSGAIVSPASTNFINSPTKVQRISFLETTKFERSYIQANKDQTILKL